MADDKVDPQLAIDLKKIREQVDRWPISAPGFDVTDPDEDAPDGAVVAAYERHGDRWESLPKGTKVSLDVPWPDGSIRRMSGTLVCVRGEEAYVETSVGAVVGDANSIEVEE